jgi:hypothetical protein
LKNKTKHGSHRVKGGGKKSVGDCKRRYIFKGGIGKLTFCEKVYEA